MSQFDMDIESARSSMSIRQGSPMQQLPAKT
jgi:hypothetical protein